MTGGGVVRSRGWGDGGSIWVHRWTYCVQVLVRELGRCILRPTTLRTLCRDGRISQTHSRTQFVSMCVHIREGKKGSLCV